MILHIPHSSTKLNGILFDKSVESELNIMTDWFTDELFFHPSAESLVFQTSRLVCDVERYKDPNNEPQEKNGMGVCYTKRSDGSTLRSVSESEREFLIGSLYKPHHKRLVNMIYSQLSLFGNVYLIDCHSFSGKRLPHEENEERPDICLGVDLLHSPANVVLELQNYFTSKGYTVLLNAPFRGTMIPEIYHNNKDFKSIMIEVNRDLYLDEQYKKNDNFENVQRDIEGALDIVDKWEKL